VSDYDQTAVHILSIVASTSECGDDKTRSIENWKNHYLTQGDDPMNADQFKGKWMQFKGELKKPYGKFTDDDLTQIEGNHDKFVGKVQERYGDKKDELMKWADQWHQQSQPDATKGKTY
jgi:uncharacterized protein YjbJ (UPF0337 family)